MFRRAPTDATVKTKRAATGGNNLRPSCDSGRMNQRYEAERCRERERAGRTRRDRPRRSGLRGQRRAQIKRASFVPGIHAPFPRPRFALSSSCWPRVPLVPEHVDFRPRDVGDTRNAIRSGDIPPSACTSACACECVCAFVCPCVCACVALARQN